MSGYNRDFVGTAKIVSGRLVIGDVDVLRKTPSSEVKKLLRAEDQMVSIGDAQAVAVATPYLNGEAKVYVSYGKDGEIIGIEIDLED